MPLGKIIAAGRKMYDSAKNADEEAFIPSLGKRNSMPTTSTRVSAREAAAAAPVNPAPKTKANPMDMGRGMGGMVGGAVNAIKQRKKMLDDM